MLSDSIADKRLERPLKSRSNTLVKETTPQLPSVDERFNNLLISSDRVAKMMGRRSPGEVSFYESEQNNARRLLLQVEKNAIKTKQIEAETAASYLEQVSALLHQRLFGEIQRQSEDTLSVLTQAVNLNESVAPLLDTLSVRATSISRIEPLAAALPWLYEDLMAVVNTPKFRRKDARGKIIPVETLRTALSFLGIDNLRLLIPSMIFKRAVPKITDPFPEIKHRLIQYAQGTGLCMRALAETHGQLPHEAFAVGLFSQLGRCAIIRLYFKFFEQLRIEMLQEAEAERDIELHSALGQIHPSANYLIAVQDAYSTRLTEQLLTAMQFKRLRLTLPVIEIQARTSPSHPLTKLLSGTRAYCAIRMLHASKFINKEETPEALSRTGLTRSERDVLKMLDIFQLPLTENTK